MIPINVGQILTGEEKKDAIHIAVIPVIAHEKVFPGQDVALVDGSTERVFVPKTTDPTKLIGIIDPFYKWAVFPEQKCWLFLYPNTITSLRHDWEHPAFVVPQIAEIPLENKLPSQKWMEDLAAEAFAPYDDRYYTVDELIEAGKEYLTSGNRLVQQGADNLRDDTNPREFWKHFENITGIVVPQHELDSIPFCCTC